MKLLKSLKLTSGNEISLYNISGKNNGKNVLIIGVFMVMSLRGYMQLKAIS